MRPELDDFHLCAPPDPRWHLIVTVIVLAALIPVGFAAGIFVGHWLTARD